jgi:hypothetical protein
MKRVQKKWVGILGIVALLFAQLVVASYACPLAGHGAPTTAAADSAEPPNTLDPDQPGLCLEHHKAGTTTVDQTQPPAMQVPVVLGLLVRVADIRLPHMRRTLPEPDADHLTSPPPSILFCVFRT